MLPFIDLGILQLPLYSLLFMIGFAIALLLARKIGGSYGINKDDIIFAAIYGAIGLLIGAKVVFFITKVPKVITHFEEFKNFIKNDTMGALNYLFGGMVFYGGLIGFCLGVLRYCVHFKVKLFDLADLYTPFLPFAHAFGRIGCFCAGCCYGIEYHGPLAIQFPYNELTPELSEVPRFPVQLLEALLNFICSGILLYIMNKNAKKEPKDRKLKQGQLLGIYFAYYLVARTFLEMLRGDAVRGKVGFLSTSQIISILLIPVAIILILAKKKQIIFAGLPLTEEHKDSNENVVQDSFETDK